MRDDWMNSIKERMESYGESVPDGVWDAIETSVIKGNRSARKAFMPWVWSMASAAAIAIGVFAGVRLYLGKPQDNIIQTYSQESRASSPIKPSSSADNGEVPASSLKPVEIVRREGAGPLAQASPAPQAEPGRAQEGAGAPEVPEAEERRPDIVNAPESPKADERKPDAAKTPEVQTDEWERYIRSMEGPRRVQKGRITAGISFTGAASTSQNQSTVESKMFYRGSAPAPKPGHTPSNSGQNDFVETRAVGPITRAETLPVTTDERHRRPVRASFTVSYPISGSLALESGLTYSQLYSTVSTISGSTLSRDARILDYLGIPLGLRYGGQDGKTFDLYASGGGMVEKCVRGRVRTTVTQDGEEKGPASESSIEIKPLSWSLNAAAGVQVNVTDRFGIYVEPGVSYHFGKKPQVSTIYTDRPFDFVMTFGARVSFRR